MIEVWAHRGASGYAPENTLPAFALAAQLKADGVELDVQLSADGEVVVIHDETLDRTTEASGLVKEYTAAQLAALDAGAGAGIPLLAEVLELLRPTGLRANIELKNSVDAYPGMEAKVLDVVAAHGMDERVIYSSFNHYSLVELRGSTPAPIGVLTSDVIFQPWAYAQTLGSDALHPYWSMLQIPDYVVQAHEAGLRVHPWTVNAETELAWVARQGVDAIITNFPDRAMAVLGR